MMKKISTKKLFTSLLMLSSVGIFSFSALPAQARTTTEDLKDLRADHWAYNGIRELVNKYDIMSGFPDGTFRGARTFTRYEAAAALYKVMLKVEEMMTGQPQQPMTVKSGIAPEDLKMIKDLTEEFRRELDAMKAANAGQFAKIKSLEEGLEKVKSGFGAVRFGGYFDSGLEDKFEDNFRPAYSANYDLDMKATINDSTFVKAKFGGSFSSEQTEEEKDGKKIKKVVETPTIGFGTAWFNYAPANTFLNPKVKVGYMNLGNLISTGTSVSSYFSGATGLASPNLNRSGKRGIRSTSSVTGGFEVGSGPFTMAFAANPQIFAGMIKLDFGLAKLKFVADVDQTMFFGENVQDTIHNQGLILDLGNDNFGFAAQANFRGVADDYKWTAASGLLYMNLWGLELGGSGKFENESSQQLVVGGFIKTPDKVGSTSIPSLQVSIQEPLTLLNGTIFEGSLLDDKAGISVQITYDNPFLPGLTIYYDHKAVILFSDDPKDIISNTIGVNTSMSF